MTASWTQPVCANKYQELYPGRTPYLMQTDLTPEEMDKCCFCGMPTNIYIRIDPSTVPFPREE